jgi:hypothetical protein
MAEAIARAWNPHRTRNGLGRKRPVRSIFVIQPGMLSSWPRRHCGAAVRNFEGNGFCQGCECDVNVLLFFVAAACQRVGLSLPSLDLQVFHTLAHVDGRSLNPMVN